MSAVIFATIAGVGLIEFGNCLFDDTPDTQTLIRGRLGALALAIGVLGSVLEALL